MKSNKVCLYWFRNDLRLNDNSALSRAAENHESILPIYIFDEDKSYPLGSANKVWLYHSLDKLNKSLSNKLSIYQGDPLNIIQSLVKKYGVTHVYWNNSYEPWQDLIDEKVKQTLIQANIVVETYNSYLLWEPKSILKNDGTPYKVFTAFYKNGCLKATAPKAPISMPPLSLIKDHHSSKELSDLDLLPEKNWHKRLSLVKYAGEESAYKILSLFLSNNLENYKELRDVPSADITSKLSIALHFGEISPNIIWYETLNQKRSDDQENFLRQLVWREFSYNQLFHVNELAVKNLNHKFDRYAWENNLKLFNAWKKGMTGIPIIDAGMRELWSTGIMHNRVRMLCASFLTKNCLVDWRFGAKWFWDCLFDADLANNSASWQWVAGSGLDAAPYFRIFNPTLQALKFDAEAIYIKKFVPEIAQLPLKYIFEPWKAPTAILNENNIEIGKTYPFPIVDLKESRQKALENYRMLSN